MLNLRSAITSNSNFSSILPKFLNYILVIDKISVYIVRYMACCKYTLKSADNYCNMQYIKLKIKNQYIFYFEYLKNKQR